jgi:NADPH-dependent 2,4-dienoyl-CoA reductase/sulfur reductase-like enzyme
VPNADQLTHRTRGELDQTGMALRLNTPATRIDPDAQRVIHRDGELADDALIVATGAQPIRPTARPRPSQRARAAHGGRARHATGARDFCSRTKGESLTIRPRHDSRRIGDGRRCRVSPQWRYRRAGRIIAGSGLRRRRSGLGGGDSEVGRGAGEPAIHLLPRIRDLSCPASFAPQLWTL